MGTEHSMEDHNIGEYIANSLEHSSAADPKNIWRHRVIQDYYKVTVISHQTSGIRHQTSDIARHRKMRSRRLVNRSVSQAKIWWYVWSIEKKLYGLRLTANKYR